MVEPDDELEPLTWRDRGYNGVQRVIFVAYSIIIIFLLLLGLLWQRVFINVEPGHRAVKYEPLGVGTLTQKEQIYGEGLQVILPWNSLYIYETRMQQRFMEMTILSNEGLSLTVVVSIRFEPKTDMLGHLHQDIGPEYYERLLRPQVESHLREILGSRPAYDIYSSAGDLIQKVTQMTTLIKIEGDNELGPYVDVHEVKIVDVDLPEIVHQAIADRYRQEQLMLEYEYRLVREEKEAQRKRIEAKGVADYNVVVGEDWLRWRDVEAVKALANSPNTKILMLGGSAKDGQPPLIFSLGEGTAPAASAESTEPSPETPPEQLPDAGVVE